MIPEGEAQTIITGFQLGAIDTIDLMSMLDNYEEWLNDSNSSTADIVRQNRRANLQ